MHTLGDRSLFFLHIPKTAGTSLRELLSCRFAPTDILALLRSDGRGARAQQLADVAQVPIRSWTRAVCAGRSLSAAAVRGDAPARSGRVGRSPPSTTCGVRRGRSRSPMPGWAVPRGHATTPRRPGCRSPNSSATRRLPHPVTLATSRCRFWPPATCTSGSSYSDDYRISISRADLERAKAHLAACECVGITERMVESIEVLAVRADDGAARRGELGQQDPGAPADRRARRRHGGGAARSHCLGSRALHVRVRAVRGSPARHDAAAPLPARRSRSRGRRRPGSRASAGVQLRGSGAGRRLGTCAAARRRPLVRAGPVRLAPRRSSWRRPTERHSRCELECCTR